MKKNLDILNRIGKSLLLPVIIYIVLTVISGFQFGKPVVMLSIARQIVQPSLFAFGIYCNMVLGMWDLSAGAALLLSAIIGGQLTLVLNMGLFGLIFFSIIAAIAINIVTIIIQHFMKIPSIIVSLGLVMIYETIGSMLFGGNGVRLLSIRSQTILGKSPYCFIVLIAAMIVFHFIYNHTSFGYHVRALGQGETLAKNIGINEFKTRISCAIFGGLFIGLSAAVYACLQNAVAPKANMESAMLVFDVIMSILIASSLTRYCNITFAVIIGVLSLKMLAAGLIAMGLNSAMQNVATGLFMLIFIGINGNQERIRIKKEIEERAKKAAAHLSGTAQTAGE